MFIYYSATVNFAFVGSIDKFYLVLIRINDCRQNSLIMYKIQFIELFLMLKLVLESFAFLRLKYPTKEVLHW